MEEMFRVTKRKVAPDLVLNKTLAVSVSKKLLDAVHMAAICENVSVSEWVRDALVTSLGGSK